MRGFIIESKIRWTNLRTPFEMLIFIGKQNPDFQGFRLHDAHEFILLMLGELDKELNAPHARNVATLLLEGQTPGGIVSLLLEKDNGALVGLFQFVEKSTTRCPSSSCKKGGDKV